MLSVLKLHVLTITVSLAFAEEPARTSLHETLWKDSKRLFANDEIDDAAPPMPVAPVLHDLGVIVRNTSGYCNKDPTQVIHFNGTWHFWSSHWHCLGKPPPGFPQAEVHHFYTISPDPSGPWHTSGAAVVPGPNSAWDSWSVFTPGAIYDPDGGDGSARGAGRWYLWYGAVANDKHPTLESIGLVTAPTPFGPWTRSTHNPVFAGPPNGTAWCGLGNSARADEADAYVVGGRKMVVVKGVCQNFTALPTAWVSAGAAGSFEPPYQPLPGAMPMAGAAPTPGRKGFEQARLFPGPDGMLHMTGHDHGDNHCTHYVSKSGGVAAADWRRLPGLATMGLASMEPTPVFAGVPGDQGGVPTHFIQFNHDPEVKNLVVIHLMGVSWVPVNGSSSGMNSSASLITG